MYRLFRIVRDFRLDTHFGILYGMEVFGRSRKVLGGHGGIKKWA